MNALRPALIVIGLTLLGRGPAIGQVDMTTPTWIHHAWANEEGDSVRPYDLMAFEGNVYVTGAAGVSVKGATFGGSKVYFDGSSFLVSYQEGGTQNWVREGFMQAADEVYEPAKAGYHLAHNGVSILTTEGFLYGVVPGMPTTGGVSINGYSALGAGLWSLVLNPSIANPGLKPGFIVGFGATADGNIYTGGIFHNALIVDSDTLAAFPLEGSGEEGDIFLTSHAPDGALRWSRRLGSRHPDSIAPLADPHGAFAVDEAGNTYLGGFFGEGAVFGELQPGGVTLARDAFVLVSYDASGGLRWVRTERDLGFSENAGPRHLAVDGQGNLFVNWIVFPGGGVQAVTVGDTTFSDPGFGGEVLTKLSPEGELDWVRQLRSDSSSVVTDVVVDGTGAVYIGGYFDGAYLDLEGTVVQKQDLQAEAADGFVARYDAGGNVLWVGHARGEGTQRILALDVGETGDLYVAGEFEQELGLGQETVKAGGSSGFDLFVARYGAATITASERYGAPESRAVVAVAVYPNPFNPSTEVHFTLPEPAYVSLVVYDLLGREVARLEEGLLRGGSHTTPFDASHLPGGFYFYRLQAGSSAQSGPMILVK